MQLCRVRATIRFPVGSLRRVEKQYCTCCLSSRVLSVNGRVEGNSSHAVMALTRHSWSIHCGRGRVFHGAKWRRAAQTTRVTPQGVKKRV